MQKKADLYRQAYARYLRRGTPIELSLKAAEHPMPYYVWRTRGDDKVRPSHAANNGRIFAWDKPPPTGNPGKDFGCRCHAEPYIAGQTEYAFQGMITAMMDSTPKWTNEDFVHHFYFGGGRGLMLAETGHLAGVINYYFYSLTKEGQRIYDRINKQIINEARKHAYRFGYHFDDSYDFKSYLYVFGKSTVSGVFSGTVRYLWLINT